MDRIKRAVVLSSFSLLAACFGPPSETGYYKEIMGPVSSGCMNKYHVVVDETSCGDYRVGNVVVALLPRGTVQYHQDPERSPYKWPILACTMERDLGFDFKENLRVERFELVTNTGKAYSDFKWGFVNFNEDCKYISISPRVDVKVYEETEVGVELLIKVLAPEVATKEMQFLFKGVTQ